MTMNTAALYLRSSKDRSDVSIDAQRRELTNLATERKLRIVTEFTDVVESAKTERRPGFQELMSELKAPNRGWSHLLMVDTSRLSRRRYAAQVFKHECSKRNVTILYSKVPETDPITQVILDSVFEAMDEVHSLMSREKGLAGMAENVRQGFRAGGRAPFGYKLNTVHTGSVREGEPVSKTVLVTDENASLIADFLKRRAVGTPRKAAAMSAGMKQPGSTLIGYEWNALTYAGHTVWNVHAERMGGEHKGNHKRRPREEWVIQENTHPALITTEEAEAILQQLESSPMGKAVSEGKTAASRYLLSGLLMSPDDKAWLADSGKYYRTKGRKVRIADTDDAVFNMVVQDIRSPAFVRALTNEARKFTDGDNDPAEELRFELATLSTQIDRFVELAGELNDPAPMLRKIDALETRRKTIVAEISKLEREYAKSRALAVLTEENVRAFLDGFLRDLEAGQKHELKQLIRAIIEKVALDPDTLQARIHYRLAVDARGVSMASPRGFELVHPKPVDLEKQRISIVLEKIRLIRSFVGSLDHLQAWSSEQSQRPRPAIPSIDLKATTENFGVGVPELSVDDEVA